MCVHRLSCLLGPALRLDAENDLPQLLASPELHSDVADSHDGDEAYAKEIADNQKLWDEKYKPMFPTFVRVTAQEGCL